MHKCNVCGEGTLSTVYSATQFSYAGRNCSVQLRLNKCNFCGSEIANEEDSIFNRRMVNRFKKTVDNIPSGTRIRELRKQLKLTQAQAGKVFGGGPVAFAKYESDDVIPDAAMANLLRLAIVDPELVKKMKDLRDGSVIFGTGMYSADSSDKGYSADLEDEAAESPPQEGISLSSTSEIDSDLSSEWVLGHG